MEKYRVLRKTGFEDGVMHFTTIATFASYEEALICAEDYKSTSEADVFVAEPEAA